ncbi:MAG: Rne/Rng family ribonuclease [Aquamicrobium sp.]|uniref:ribonuclease E/G n=1 Tax=Aquamicrobium sp. TaxID=1872579 RepID=UPI00349E7397|nr:Rne/Rng family ribonuclease [Aquamicrobium sp.]
MPNKMLIDASHPEETRVVVVRGNRIEEFDFESQNKKQLKGNIYLARVTRVEPSLQAAFVEYGGNRHGFLAFSEIHPDYYQIPVADRQALLRAEAEEAQAEEDEEEENEERRNGKRRRRGRGRGRASDAGKAAAASETADEAEAAPEDGDDEAAAEDAVAEVVVDEDDAGNGPAMAESVAGDVVSEEIAETGDSAGADDDNGSDSGDDNGNGDDEVVSVGADDALEEVHERRRPQRKQYKIQEVIKRRQILLVQVVKEERGNKGAALTTYLSLAGRYSVLMPNTARGGGISRKITNAADRKRLKDVVKDLEVPQGMGVILRTAGESRTKAEIKRDYEYLMRLWDNVRELTLQSTAPALVYEEGSLIKRSVRDLYNKDISEILVAGDDGYREAKDFMRMLMPSHAKVVQPYRETVPIFARNGIEAQLDRMVQPQVTLKSGGYLIINQTEALVAIDVNSGRSTKEHSIEDTALQTNLEAAEEVARQLRLRDLAGLIVIDFIDMEENRNNRAVEKRLKDCLKNDRARIQVGRISHFGLLEMSRQRLRASVLESTMQVCPHCGGTGHVRSESSVALLVIRAVEEFLLKDSRNHITVKTPTSTAIYVLNHKRSTLADLENRFGLTITVEADESVRAQHYVVVKGEIAERPAGFVPAAAPVYPDEPEDEIDDIVEEADDEAEEEARPQQAARQADGEDGNGQRKRKRRRRRRKDRDGAPAQGEQQATASDEESAAISGSADDEADDDEAGATVAGTDEDTDGQPKKRRRGKRGGRRNRRDEAGDEAGAAEDGAQEAGETAIVDFAAQAAIEATPADDVVAEVAEIEDAVAEEAPKKKPARRAPRKAKPIEVEPPADPEVVEAVSVLDDAPTAEEAEEAPAKPKRAPRRKSTAKAKAEAAEEVAATVSEVVAEAAAEPAEASVAEVVETVEVEEEPAAPRAPAEPVVTSSRPAASAEGEKPRKGGWWQRKGFF